MAAASGRAFEQDHAFVSESQRLDRLRRLQRLSRVAKLMDTAVGIPFTKFRWGFDSIVGLVPGVGDAAALLPGMYIVYEARRLGLPREKILRMLANIGLDAAIGTIPLAGDLFDVLFKANLRNLRIVLDHFPDEQVELQRRRK